MRVFPIISGAHHANEVFPVDCKNNGIVHGPDKNVSVGLDV